jgi:hypothetical protein
MVDKRDETVRATAQKVVVVSRERANSAPRVAESTREDEASLILLQFSSAATREELQEVRQLLASSPGERPVQLLFERPGGNSLRLDAGPDYRINLTRDLEERLARWLIDTKCERSSEVLQTSA